MKDTSKVNKTAIIDDVELSLLTESSVGQYDVNLINQPTIRILIAI